jgi:hypothetical protein
MTSIEIGKHTSSNKMLDVVSELKEIGYSNPEQLISNYINLHSEEVHVLTSTEIVDSILFSLH